MVAILSDRATIIDPARKGAGQGPLRRKPEQVLDSPPQYPRTGATFIREPSQRVDHFGWYGGLQASQGNSDLKRQTAVEFQDRRALLRADYAGCYASILLSFGIDPLDGVTGVTAGTSDA
jgi:hypothetical protein